MEITDMNWRKSSHSGGNGGSCIEVASDRAVLVRDTTDRADSVLAFSSAAWLQLVAELKRSLAADPSQPL